MDIWLCVDVHFQLCEFILFRHLMAGGNVYLRFVIIFSTNGCCYRSDAKGAIINQITGFRCSAEGVYSHAQWCNAVSTTPCWSLYQAPLLNREATKRHRNPPPPNIFFFFQIPRPLCRIHEQRRIFHIRHRCAVVVLSAVSNSNGEILTHINITNFYLSSKHINRQHSYSPADRHRIRFSFSPVHTDNNYRYPVSVCLLLFRQYHNQCMWGCGRCCLPNPMVSISKKFPTIFDINHSTIASAIVYQWIQDNAVFVARFYQCESNQELFIWNDYKICWQTYTIKNRFVYFTAIEYGRLLLSAVEEFEIKKMLRLTISINFYLIF